MENTITSNSAVNVSESLTADDSSHIDNPKTDDTPRSTSSALGALSGAESVLANDIDQEANDILSDPTQLAAIMSAALDNV